ncbi:MAG: PQQ-binding-like beta-propeller repeat protein [Pirellulaceae bacterium]
MKYVPDVALRVMLIATVLAIIPLTGCIGPYRGASSSTTGSRSTYAGSTLSSHRTLASRATGASRSTFPLRSGSSSSSDPKVQIREPLVVAQAPKADEAATDEKPEVKVEEPKIVEVDPLDWLYCRGPHYDGTSLETGLPDSLEAEGEESLVSWKRDDLGGRSTPTVMNGKLYVLVRAEPETPREGERVVCLDAATGETLWENRFNVWLSDVPDTRVGWSSVVCDAETGNVYAQGVCGYFQCLNGETGETIWSVPMHEQFGLLSTYGGRTNFPIIVDDLVITSAIIIGWGDQAKPAHRFIGFDKRSGEVVWFSGTRELPYDTTYSAPALAVIDGQRQLVFGSGDGDIWGMQPLTGQTIWNYKFSMRGINTAPVVVGDIVYAGHSEENIPREGFASSMGGLAAIKGNLTGDVTESGEVWRVTEMMIGKSAPLVVDDVVYAFDDRAKMYTFDAKSGEELERKALGTVMRANPLYADGKIYAITAGSSRWYVLKPDPEEKGAVEEVSKGRFPNGEEVQASPIVSHGRIYVQSSGGLYCFEDKDKEHGVAEAKTEAAKEAPVSEDEKPAHVQIVPAELLMEPGRIVTFKARLFNSRGQFLREADDAEFSLEGSGEITPDGTYLSTSDPVHEAAYISASVGDLKGSARVRIVPPLPWHFEFTGLKEPPVTWVGARYRHTIREVDGDNVMVKVTTIPKGTRSRAWFGHPELSDYTIQADVRGSKTDNKMPDIGLTNQGYALDLQGASQKFEVRTWVTQRRMAKAIDFEWQPDTWYTMKLQVNVADAGDSPTGKRAIVRGKIWPRGEDEPSEWTIEATDDSPNLSGSPGLYGNAKDAEIFLDNIRVFANGESAE